VSYKIDLHTHSYGSSDGALKLRDYRYFLQNELLDYIAITDHGRIDTATKLQHELGELGSHIIIGEEIMTTAGELIGLYLHEPVPHGLTPTETVQAIHAQGGLVYLPHPFETVRSGFQAAALTSIAADIDIVETRNGRAVFQNRGPQARHWAGEHALPGAASSDAHGRFGWGYTYSIIDTVPTVRNLAQLLHSAEYSTRTVGLGIVYPKLNRLRKALTH
jgi:predicted metal-dependent phosphoesterase TrpH